MKKTNSAQVSLAGPVPRARPQPLTGGPRLSAPARAHVSLSLPLAASGADLSAPLLVVHALVPNLSPAHSHRGHAHVCAFPGHLRMPSPPLELAPCSPTPPCSFAPSPEHPRPLSRPARASKKLRHRSPKPVARSSTVVEPPSRRCLGEVRLAVSNSGHPSICP